MALPATLALAPAPLKPVPKSLVSFLASLVF